MSLVYNTYKTDLLRIKRGNCRGIFSNAKPIFMVSLIDAINEGLILGNKIPFASEGLKGIYDYNSAYNCSVQDIVRRNSFTEYRLPYFHMNAESFYHIKWKPELYDIPRQGESPSNKFMSTFVDYAYLDDGLWELLQDASVREEFRAAIINHYLKEK